MLFLTRLQQQSQQLAYKVALEMVGPHPAGCVTYGALEQMVQRTMAYLLALGTRPGDRVALQLPKGLPFIYLHLAIMRLQAISLPLNPAYGAAEMAYFLGDAGARLLFADAAARDWLEPILPTLPDLAQTIYLPAGEAAFAALLPAGAHPTLPPLPADPQATALMIYTSGTTGRAKGAQITHGNLTANLDSLHEAWGWQASDVLLHALPLFHVHGLNVALHGALHAGATCLLLPKFEPRAALQALVDRRCTVFMGVPTIHKRLVDWPQAADYDLGHMRLLTSGSDRLPDALFERFRQTFGHTLLERYGLTETGMNLSNPLHGERRVGSVGLPLPGVGVRIADPETDAPLPDGVVGEVQVRGAHVFKGYWQRPQQTAAAFTADGWLRTGDLGERAADGYFTLKGRRKDLIITGGLNVYPPEVELVLAAHPAVAACAVIGCPDGDWGERVVAVVVLVPGRGTTPEALIEHCRQQLAGYKTPRQVWLADALPRNALGKVQKGVLRAQFCAAGGGGNGQQLTLTDLPTNAFV